MNQFQTTEDRRPDLLRVDESVWKAQVERLGQLRAGRDNKAVEHALAALQNESQRDENLMPFILQAVEAYATTGEICNVLRRVFGEYQPPMAL